MSGGGRSGGGGARLRGSHLGEQSSKPQLRKDSLRPTRITDGEIKREGDETIEATLQKSIKDGYLFVLFLLVLLRVLLGFWSFGSRRKEPARGREEGGTSASGFYRILRVFSFFFLLILIFHCFLTPMERSYHCILLNFIAFIPRRSKGCKQPAQETGFCLSYNHDTPGFSGKRRARANRDGPHGKRARAIRSGCS